MTAPPTKTARLEIWRGTDRADGRFEIHEVAFQDGDSVLDGLIRLRSEGLSDLAFRYSCFNANVCKECTMLIDGRVEYACIARLTETLTRLEPMPKMAVLRDLVTDTLTPREKP
ncbi:2Fe-2S iron-sulfur cluster-binding protein [Ancylobacter mangrovi]|uniref:succinate dehydrogenase n=1 Tax=Ancylobacter mangrovi TaxID=2972472 RepID=A0A9X2T3M6_9HYPH|nr:2Fe-2S iron-sulfur cluster-binding protein [Ancylobacter mangrovi]MCS0497302.1 2Fe-2S iron-sulfur cluster-binding protein [Ancylobacter mangrovi]MCS0505126.1 2Fe-2S iron-sulfur cluster-binding protein [Ancylobacter mangrovi]